MSSFDKLFKIIAAKSKPTPFYSPNEYNFLKYYIVSSENPENNEYTQEFLDIFPHKTKEQIDLLLANTAFIMLQHEYSKLEKEIKDLKELSSISNNQNSTFSSLCSRHPKINRKRNVQSQSDDSKIFSGFDAFSNVPATIDQKNGVRSTEDHTKNKRFNKHP
jgi:hypothetical protein